MRIIKKCIDLLKNLIHKIRFRMKLKQMDDRWYFMGGNCFDLFPPSFYYTHTEEEIKRITEETMAELQALFDKYIAENNLTFQDEE